MILAQDFASSPAGYITGVMTPLMAAMGGYGIRSWLHARKADDERTSVTADTLAKHSQALTALVEALPQINGKIDQLDRKYISLDKANALLDQALHNLVAKVDGR